MRCSWNEPTAAIGGFFDGPHYDEDHHNCYIWCSRCGNIGCWWKNESCTAKVKIDESSPDFQKVKKRKERFKHQYQMRIARKEEREKKKKKGLEAAEAFKFRK